MTTQHVRASYQEIIDLHTESDRVSVLGFHTPSNAEPVRLLRPFWDAYQKVRYLGCSMSLVPAARLPADPSQVSYEAGTPPLDPRDLLNPILFKGCHGNDMGSILNQFYSGEGGSGTDIDRLFSDSMDHNMVKTNRVGNTAVFESLYYRALTDNTWLKAHPQRGFRKNMRPMVYRVAVNTPFNPGDAGTKAGSVAQAAGAIATVDTGTRTNPWPNTFGPGSDGNMKTTKMPGLQKTESSGSGSDLVITWSNPGTYSGQQWMTPGIRPLGWIDTRQPTIGDGYTNSYPVGATVPSEADMALNIMTNYYVNEGKYCYIPKVFMGMCLLPPAYRMEQYFRIILNHHFAFAKYRGTSMRNAGSTGAAMVVDMNGTTSSKGVDDDDLKDGEEGVDDGFEPDDKGILDD